MIEPKIPAQEIKRLAALKNYELLDTEAEEIFDSITYLAAMVCEVPICLVSLVDENRQWFKSHYGLDATETPRSVSFCGHAINQSEIFCVKNALADERFYDNPLVTGEPRVVFYAGKPLVDHQGNVIGTLCVIDHYPRELTKKQYRQLNLIGEQLMHVIQTRILTRKREESNALLNKLSQSLPGMIYTYQMDAFGKSTIPYSSKQIQEIFELSSDQVKRDASILFTRLHPDDYTRVIKSINGSVNNLKKWNCDFRVILPVKGERWLRGCASSSKSPSGEIVWHGYMTDITELKQHEEIVSTTAKMATLGEMSAGIAHEINNPLTIIKTASNQLLAMIKRQEYDEEKCIKYLDKINVTTDRITKIVKGLKFFTSGQQKTMDFLPEKLLYILDETISLSNEKFKNNNIELFLKYPQNMDRIEIDCHAVEISQVLLNLLNNSFDAIESLSSKWIEIEVVDLGEKVQISVTDSGNGIDEQIAKNILRPFYTTKPAGKGTGLGLSIVQRIIESHGGNLKIDCKCHHTRFVIDLPKKHNDLQLAG